MSFPPADRIALEHSEKLSQFIRQEIEKTAQGYISFARFMQLALYAPGLGYYSAGAHKFGRGGDFVTAPEISPLFARCVAQHCHAVLSELGSGDMLEIGAGSGLFAKEILCELEKLNHLPEHYFILEISAELRERQQQFLQSVCPHLFSRIQWLDALPKELTGVIFANEVLDAMPVHCFRIEEDIKERCVTWEKNHFAWKTVPAIADIRKSMENFSLPAGYESEINLMISAWINSLGDSLKKGVILLSDYGYGRKEYYHPDRQQGTLMCFYQHHRHANPFIHVGLQDITAHVDFTRVAESAMDASLSLGGYTTQGAFLLGCGLLELADENRLSTKEIYQQNQAIKTLTLPSQMGELIKVMALTKHVDFPLKGFELHDRKKDL